MPLPPPRLPHACAVLLQCQRACSSHLSVHEFGLASALNLWNPSTLHRRSMGDALAQQVEKGPFNVRRNLLTAGYGALAVGPVGHAW